MGVFPWRKVNMKSDAAYWREFATRYTAAWCSNDPARVSECFSADGSLRVNDAAPAMGRSAIQEVAQGFMAMFPDMELTMDDLKTDGGRAIYHWTLAGTNTGPAGTGKNVRISGYEEWKIGADGLIAESLGHFDEEHFQRQLKIGIE
jgi:nuclear transport factor 2 (NTF2) superfamily protein